MILVATPTRGEVQATYAVDLVYLLKDSDARYGIALGTIIPNNRIHLVNLALKEQASHILFIDSDMRFPADTIERLLAADKDIVGANCRQRTQDQWTARRGEEFISSSNQTGLEEVDTLGFGVTLIKMSVFNQIPKPWFAMPYHTKEEKLIGEDVFFCTVAQEQGIKIWVDHDLSQEVKHIGIKE